MPNISIWPNQGKLGRAVPLAVLFFADLALKLIYLPFFYYRHSDTGVVIGAVDGLAYLLKSLEIAGGDFTPIRTHGIGLPLLAAPIFKLLGSQSIFVNMVYAHFINIFISSLCIFPLYFIAKKVFSFNNHDQNNDIRCRYFAYLTIFLFILSFWWLYAAIGFFAEPLFTLILLIMLLFLIKAADDWHWLLAAAALAGLGYWVKPTGILLLVITLVTATVIPPLGGGIQFVTTKRRLLRPFGARDDNKASHGTRNDDTLSVIASSAPARGRSEAILKQILIIIVIFLAVSAPFLWQRNVHFGSPFDYGENSRYFVDRYDQAWGQKDSAVSFSQYLKTHRWPDYFQKFIFLGLGALIFSLLAIALPYSIFSIWGMIIGLRSPPLWPLLITIAVWLIGLTPVYQVYFTPRHLFPLIPLMAIFASFALKEIASVPRNKFGVPRNDGEGAVIASLALARERGEAIPASNKKIASPRFAGLAMTTTATTILFFIAGFVSPQYYFLNPRSHKELEFGRWAAANLRGKLAIGIGGDFVIMNLADATIGGRGLFDIHAPHSGLELVYPGFFADYNQMKNWLQKNSVRYLALVQDNSRQRIIVPPLIYDGEIPPEDFEKIYSAADFKINWQIDIYKTKGRIP